MPSEDRSKVSKPNPLCPFIDIIHSIQISTFWNMQATNLKVPKAAVIMHLHIPQTELLKLKPPPTFPWKTLGDFFFAGLLTAFISLHQKLRKKSKE